MIFDEIYCGIKWVTKDQLAKEYSEMIDTKAVRALADRLSSRRKWHEARGGDDGGTWLEDEAADMLRQCADRVDMLETSNALGIETIRESKVDIDTLRELVREAYHRPYGAQSYDWYRRAEKALGE
jgi:hypothetical protein